MAKQIKKSTARTVAAPKAAKPKADNSAMIKLAGDYSEKATNFVGQLQLEYALKARDILAADENADIAPLAKAFGRQRKSDLMAIVGGSEADVSAAMMAARGKRKPGLQQTARALKLIQFGVSAESKESKAYIARGAKSDWLAATGQTEEKPVESLKVMPQSAGSESDEAPAAKGAEKRHDAPNGFKLIHDGLEQLRKEYAKEKGVQAIIAELEGLYAELVSATATK